MIEDRKLIYKCAEHGLYYEGESAFETKKIVTLAIDTLQLEIDYFTGSILSVTGFLPLFRSKKTSVEIPRKIEGVFFVPMKDIEYKKGIAYDFFKYFPQSAIYFLEDGLPVLEYDEEKKRILVGSNGDSNDKYVKINKNVICGLDTENNVKSLFILLDIAIK